MHVRRWLHERAGSKCEECQWSKVNRFTGKVPLTVNHIDGDSSNHRPENLELICWSCHSLTESFGSRNRGKGRKKRTGSMTQNAKGAPEGTPFEMVEPVGVEPTTFCLQSKRSTN